MSNDKAKVTIPERDPEERRRRFGWVDDDVLQLQIESPRIESTPPEPATPAKRD